MICLICIISIVYVVYYTHNTQQDVAIPQTQDLENQNDPNWTLQTLQDQIRSNPLFEEIFLNTRDNAASLDEHVSMMMSSFRLPDSFDARLTEQIARAIIETRNLQDGYTYTPAIIDNGTTSDLSNDAPLLQQDIQPQALTPATHHYDPNIDMGCS